MRYLIYAFKSRVNVNATEAIIVIVLAKIHSTRCFVFHVNIFSNIKNFYYCCKWKILDGILCNAQTLTEVVSLTVIGPEKSLVL